MTELQFSTQLIRQFYILYTKRHYTHTHTHQPLPTTRKTFTHKEEEEEKRNPRIIIKLGGLEFPPSDRGERKQRGKDPHINLAAPLVE